MIFVDGGSDDGIGERWKDEAGVSYKVKIISSHSKVKCQTYQRNTYILETPVSCRLDKASLGNEFFAKCELPRNEKHKP